MSGKTRRNTSEFKNKKDLIRSIISKTPRKKVFV